MIELALRAGLPLIVVRTPDLVNFEAILGWVVAEIQKGRKVKQVDPDSPDADAFRKAVKAGAVMWTTQDMTSLEKVYGPLVAAEATLVLVNPKTTLPEAFDAGVMPCPPGFVRGGLLDGGVDEQTIQAILPGLSGLTWKEVGEVIRMAEAQYGELTLPAIVRTRRSCFSRGARGLQLVDLDAGEHYAPEPAIENYLGEYGPFLLHADRRMRPRGVLLYGQPGTGKSSAARRLARGFGCPLYRLDLGSVRDKWVGASEEGLRDAIAQVEREAPCVLLVDEVEKEFSDRSDAGVTQSLLAALLWWLAERRAPVVVVMTTNDREAIPPELIRAGRLDEQIELVGLEDTETVRAFAASFAATLGGPDLVERVRTHLPLHEFYEPVPQAVVEAAVLRVAREMERERR